jgi:hypothetical protein
MSTSLRQPQFRGRGIVVGVLIGLASVMVLVGVVAIWLNTVVYDTPTWRATSQEIIQDPAMQTQVSKYVVDQLYNSTTVQNDVAGALPPQFKSFAPAVTSGLHQVAVGASERLLATKPVQNLFVTASVDAHDAFVRLIDNQAKFAKLNNGQVTLDLHPLLLQVADTAGFGAAAQNALAPTAGQIDVMNSNQLSNVQTAVRIVHAISDWALVIVVVLFAAAIWLAHGYRRRALLWSAIGILVATLVLIFVRRILGENIVNALVSDVAVRPALITAWYIGTNVIATINLTLLIVAILLVIGVWLSGAGRLSTSVRNRLAPWIVKPLYAFGIPAVILFVLIIWGPLPVFQKVIPVIIIAVLAAVGIEALRRQTIAEHSQTPSA